MKHIEGVVVRGKGEARQLGYPTANIEYAAALVIENGVWACQVMRNGITHNGLAVIGMWQQKNGLPSVEVHVLDFNTDLYGQALEVVMFEKVRELEKFTTVEALVERIKEDVVAARAIFSGLEK